jgi:hypothetical protein
MSDKEYEIMDEGEQKLKLTEYQLEADDSDVGTCSNCDSDRTKRMHAGNGEPIGCWCAHCGTMNYRDGTFIQPVKYSDYIFD